MRVISFFFFFLFIFGISVVCRALKRERWQEISHFPRFSHFTRYHRPDSPRDFRVLWSCFSLTWFPSCFCVAPCSFREFSLVRMSSRRFQSEFQRFTEQRSNLRFSLSPSFLPANTQRSYSSIIAALSDFKYEHCEADAIFAYILHILLYL